MRTEFSLSSGKVGSVVSCMDKRVELHSPEPAPPGSTVKGRVPGVTSCFLEVKVRSCRKLPESGLFLVQGRLQNATRELLAHLEEGGEPADPTSESAPPGEPG